VSAVSYLLTFQSMAGRTWCILIGLNCCRSDVSHATGGLADGYKVIYTGCGLGMFQRVDSLSSGRRHWSLACLAHT